MNGSSILPLAADLPAAELANLSLSPDAHIRAAVATHPNTAPCMLGILATEFPAEVLMNPALPLLRLADPRLTQRWPVSALLALVRQPQAPAWLRRQTLTYPSTELQVALASHPNLSTQEMQTLAHHQAWLVRARIAARTDLSPALLADLSRDRHDAVRLAVASRPDLSREFLYSFLTDASRFVQQEARRRTRPHLL